MLVEAIGTIACMLEQTPFVSSHVRSPIGRDIQLAAPANVRYRSSCRFFRAGRVAARERWSPLPAIVVRWLKVQVVRSFTIEQTSVGLIGVCYVSAVDLSRWRQR